MRRGSTENPRDGYILGCGPNSARSAWALVAQLIGEGYDSSAAIRLAAAELDGAGENGYTVDSMATCRDLGGRTIPGVTTDDSALMRCDEFASTTTQRQWLAEMGLDEAGDWLFDHDFSSFLRDYGSSLLIKATLLDIDIPCQETASQFWQLLREAVKARLAKPDGKPKAKRR